ncbi:hypothetical protein [Nocardia alba]|uniref:Tetratricopeptide repeat protein n=1 Tax=Nocardia alba TaxID=225051 RepID=A0A4R1FKR8_9NOCA|nr:hypothetical protein [Nocardia alba]TCJ95546.1 hypothetical protein DFR71_4461 [Nocardia alba]
MNDPDAQHRGDPISLDQRYDGADPIEWCGAAVYPMYTEALPAGTTSVHLRALSVMAPENVTGLGLGLSVHDGHVNLNGKSLAGVDIWSEALVGGIDISVTADAPEALFTLTPVWVAESGAHQSWTGNYGMVVDLLPDGACTLWCSTGPGTPDFNELVVELSTGPAEPADLEAATEAAEPAEPESPVEAADPIGPESFIGPAEPVEPESSVDAAEPVEPESPVEAADSVGPESFVGPAEPINPESFTDAAEPVDVESPFDAADPVTMPMPMPMPMSPAASPPSVEPTPPPASAESASSTTPPETPSAQVGPPEPPRPRQGVGGALHDLGTAMHERGEHDSARALWTQAAQAGHSGAAYDLGTLLLREGERAAAEHWWKAAAPDDPRAALALSELA